MASLNVKAVEQEDGSIEIGVEKDGAFIPFASKHSGAVAGYVDTAEKKGDSAPAEKKGGGQ